LSTERVERRLAAILAADVAGYSRLMGRDEADTLARLKAIRRELIDPKIAEHRGRVVKTTGDGILIEFPSVVEAVACAVAIQRGMPERNAATPEEQRIVFRVGVNLGDIIVEGDDIHGDGVNVAARLESLADPGGICISGTVRDHIGDRLDLTFDDLGEQNLKNIARPVMVYRVLVGDAKNAKSAATIAIGLTLKLPDKPSIAVLPFTNMSNDPDQEFFADGIAEDIITALSRYPWLFVIARNSSFTYKGSPVEIRQVGRELGVRYVLEGSLRKAANRIRVTAELIEADNGNHLWAERYDRDLADIFAVQDEISSAVAIGIAPAISDAEQQRAMRKPPESLDAWSACQRGYRHFNKATVADNAQAQRFYEQAIAIDPNFAGGYVGLARAQIQAASVLRTITLQQGQDALHTLVRSADGLARKALELDANDAEARACLGLAYWVRGQHSEALTEIDKALLISPNLATAHFFRSIVLVDSGNADEAIKSVQEWFRLDPRNPLLRVGDDVILRALYFSRQYQEAVAKARRMLREYPDFSNAYRFLAAGLAQLGRVDEAKEALQKAIAAAPETFDLYFSERLPWRRPEDHAHLVEGLGKAGWQG
jgi:adenylate cyclase